jgi:hypothetical protein
MEATGVPVHPLRRPLMSQVITPLRALWAASVCALVCAMVASAPARAHMTPSEHAYVNGVASLSYEQIAAAYNPEWRGE